MLTGFTFCIPIKNKTAQEVVTAWRNHISFLFVVCRKLLMDNAMEFKNELFSQVAEQLGVKRKICMPPCRPQSNRRVEDMRKTDMITKLICQLPDYNAFGHKGRLNFDTERVKDLGWTLEDQDVIFDPSYISDVPATAVKQRSHQMQLRSAKVQQISLNEINIGDLLQSNSVIQ